MIEGGDSGALVMSRPTDDTDDVYVYGVVIGGLIEHGVGILTVASHLDRVLMLIENNEKMGLNDNSNAVDFM